MVPPFILTMKKLLLIAMCIITLCGNAQSIISFQLTETGSFVSEEGKDFIIVPFEGETAHQIYQKLFVNASALYKNPSQVISVVEDASISIRGYSQKITYTKFLLEKKWISGFYNLNFQIKDGRVRVSAPIIDEIEEGTVKTRFSWTVEGWYKKGKPKEKAKERIELVEFNMNSLINAILGTTKTNTEEW